MEPKRGVLYSSKRAISPLIATVMLIAFAVALGAVVMNWGKGYIEDQGIIPSGEIALESPKNQLSPCEQPVQFQVLTISGRQDICFDQVGNVINYGLENNGQVPLSGGKI